MPEGQFGGNELRTPKHDEIVYWLHRKCQDYGWLLDNFSWLKGVEDREWRIPQDVDKSGAPRMTDDEQKAAMEALPTRPAFFCSSPHWEYPITREWKGKTSSIVGFVDLSIEICTSPKLYWDWKEKHYKRCWSDYDRTRVYFEVKPTMTSLGETIRQVNRYSEFAKGVFIVVTTPSDMPVEEVLSSQGIGHLIYSDNDADTTNAGKPTADEP